MSARLSFSETQGVAYPQLFSGVKWQDLESLDFSVNNGAKGELDIEYRENFVSLLKLSANVTKVTVEPSSRHELSGIECTRYPRKTTESESHHICF